MLMLMLMLASLVRTGLKDSCNYVAVPHDVRFSLKKLRIYAIFIYFSYLAVKREDDAAKNDSKAEEDRPAPGLGGTNVRFPSKL